MSSQQSCDHHEPNRGIPDTRSRKRILEQFAAARALGEAFRALALGSAVEVALSAPTGLLARPTITLDLERFLEAWTAYVDWHRQQPRGDDLVPPFPPAEIRIPPDGTESEAEAISPST